MKITLYENLRAVPYVPFYAALELGTFQAEGLDIRVATSPGPDRTAKDLMEGKADVAWGGPARVLHEYDEDPNCGLICFCQVVARDPFFLVGNEPNSSFTLEDLMDVRVGTVAEVPTPWLCLQHDLRLLGMEPESLERVSDETMADNIVALKNGALDVIQIYEPYVEMLVKDGIGHVWSAAADRGAVAYTTFYTTAGFLRDCPEVAHGLSRSMFRTLKWLHHQTPTTIARLVSGYFPELSFRTLRGAIARYQAVQLWGSHTLVGQRGFEWLKSALISGGRISMGMAYQSCVVTGFDERVIVEAPLPPSG
ncbi:MAG: hypothetical protein CL569_19325 [Alphaproteobacteria bacterium]|nr:hypothetical protein [Alphaproteobacteria bacterium]|tara:strand:- start:8542 stop:9468 length:927 start_codon:yes stop_codon:yes gene_type:complete